MDGMVKSKPVQLLFIVLILVVTVTIFPHVFAQYQYGQGQARIIFSSSNSTHATILSSSPNSIISSNVYSNSTQTITTHQSANAVPEFGSIAPIILVISVIVIIMLNVKTRFFNINHSGGT